MQKQAGATAGGWKRSLAERFTTSRESGVLRLYLVGGAYRQISKPAEVVLVAELLGRLGANR